jgi:hypothetical protein
MLTALAIRTKPKPESIAPEIKSPATPLSQPLAENDKSTLGKRKREIGDEINFIEIQNRNLEHHQKILDVRRGGLQKRRTALGQEATGLERLMEGAQL